jgi:hypothetical protein
MTWARAAVLCLAASAAGDRDPHYATMRWARGKLPTPGAAHCPEMVDMGEWSICWPPVQRAIDAGSCIVYSFGVAEEDPFTIGMAARGCQVFAFDPAFKHTEHPWPGVTFRHYGLVSGQADENAFSGHYGSTRDGRYVTLDAIKREFGHSHITVMKMDCEGCEWDVYSRMMAGNSVHTIDQLLTEVHFSGSLRFDVNKSAHLVPVFDEMVQKHFVVFKAERNAGFRRDTLRFAGPEFLHRRGINRCCLELGLISERAFAGAGVPAPGAEDARRAQLEKRLRIMAQRRTKLQGQLEEVEERRKGIQAELQSA